MHNGTQPLEIISLDSGGGPINLTQAGISTLSVTSDGIISVLRNNNNVGTGGAHFSIRNLNTGTNADAVISWRSGTQPYWFGGVDASDNSWKLGLSPSGVDLGNSNFDGNTKLTVNALGEVTVGSITMDDVPFIRMKPNITKNHTVTTTYNEMSAGPIIINSGVIVTVNSGATWTVV